MPWLIICLAWLSTPVLDLLAIRLTPLVWRGAFGADDSCSSGRRSAGDVEAVGVLPT